MPNLAQDELFGLIEQFLQFTADLLFQFTHLPFFGWKPKNYTLAKITILLRTKITILINLFDITIYYKNGSTAQF